MNHSCIKERQPIAELLQMTWKHSGPGVCGPAVSAVILWTALPRSRNMILMRASLLFITLWRPRPRPDAFSLRAVDTWASVPRPLAPAIDSTCWKTVEFLSCCDQIVWGTARGCPGWRLLEATEATMIQLVFVTKCTVLIDWSATALRTVWWTARLLKSLMSMSGDSI